jgi:hypothetical protein
MDKAIGDWSEATAHMTGRGPAVPEVRHYIALIGGAHAHARLTATQVDSFAKLRLSDPIDIGSDGNRWYPVSSEIAQEWTTDEHPGAEHE